jgi:geranylgeranyl reductase family protein
MNQFDVAIIGAGPGGSAAAITLSRAGYSVALLDKERFPREKLCGDFVNPANWPLFRDLGIEEQILSSDHEQVTTFRISSFSGAEAEVPLWPRNGQAVFGLGLRRASLDNLLLKKADSEGASVWQGCRVIGLNHEARRWSLAVERGRSIEEVHPRALIGADGRNSWVAHRLGLARRLKIRERSVGFQLWLKCANQGRGKVEIHTFPGGYAGLVGLSDGMVNLCFAIEKDQLWRHRSFDGLLESCLTQNPHLKEVLARSERVGAIRSTYPVYFPPRRSYADGVLLVGDAARVSEPVTGEGIYFALKSGVLAARSIDQAFQRSDFSTDHLRSYERNCRRTFRVRRSINSLIRLLIYRPALLSPIIRFSARRARILDSIVHTICQPEIAR